MPLQTQGLRVHPDWRRQWQAGAASPYPSASPHDLAWRFAREIDRQNPDGTIEDDSIDHGLLPPTQTLEERTPRAEPQDSLLEKPVDRTRSWNKDEPLAQVVQAQHEARPANDFRAADAPVINDRHQRRDAILSGSPAQFSIGDRPPRQPADLPSSLWERGAPAHDAAVRMIKQHAPIFEDEAKKAGVDPDLVRALSYVEIARGLPGDSLKAHVVEPAIDNKVIGNRPIPDWVPGHADMNAVLSKRESFLPMNINPTLWGDFSGGSNVSGDVRANIRAGAKLAKELERRIVDPTPAKIGSLYNSLAAEHINRHGDRVQKAYERKLWLKDDPSDSSDWFMD